MQLPPLSLLTPNPRSQSSFISWSALLLFCGIGIFPVLLMIIGSFSGESGFSFQHYQSLLTENRTLTLLARSCGMAFGATILSLIIGTPLAMSLVKTVFRGHAFCSVVYLVPLFIPPHIHALAWLYLLGEKGLIQLFLMKIFGSTAPVINIYSPTGAAAILFLAYFPIYVLTLTTGLSMVDRRQEEAAAFHADTLTIWRKITLPLITPYIISGAVFVFIFSFFNYGVPSMLRVSSFPVEIFARFSAFYDEAGATALSMVLVLVAVILLFVQQKFMAGKSYITIHNGSRQNSSESSTNQLAGLLVWGFLLIVIITPLAALGLQAGSLTSFQMSFQTSLLEIKTSILISVASATLATILAYFLASYIHELQGWWKNLADIFTLLPFGFPAALFGIGLIHLWNSESTEFIYGTALILIIAYIARFIPFGIRIILSNLSQLSPAMKESALLCEGNSLKRLLKIDLPLARRGLLICWIIVFIFSMGELGATLLVIPPGLGTISLKIYTLMHYGAGPLVAALGLILIGINLLVSSTLLFNTGKQ